MNAIAYAISIMKEKNATKRKNAIFKTFKTLTVLKIVKLYRGLESIKIVIAVAKKIIAVLPAKYIYPVIIMIFNAKMMEL